MRKIKKFERLSVMKISAICYAILGLLEGIMFSLVFLVAPFPKNGNDQLPRFLGPIFGVFSIVFFQILFVIIGAIAGGLGAVVYNVSARYVGGIEVEVE